MAAPRRVIELAFSEQELADLTRVSRSRTEPASRVERARMLLAYRETPSLYAAGRAIGVTHQTVERCLRRAQEFGIMAALDDSPRPGRDRTITSEARAFVVDLACRKPKDLGYPHELWTTRLLARHVREQGPAAGHACLAKLAQGTLCKILAAHEIKPHKVRYYLERRDPEFAEKMAEVLCVYREVALLKQAAQGQPEEGPAVAIISYDEKPGIQARPMTSAGRFSPLGPRGIGVPVNQSTSQSQQGLMLGGNRPAIEKGSDFDASNRAARWKIRLMHDVCVHRVVVAAEIPSITIRTIGKLSETPFLAGDVFQALQSFNDKNLSSHARVEKLLANNFLVDFDHCFVRQFLGGRFDDLSGGLNRALRVGAESWNVSAPP